VNPVRIAPSLLAADFTDIGGAVRSVEAAGADLIHLDVMDGHFVPNITFGPAMVAAARRCTSLPLDVHLMIQNPERYIDAFVEAGADVVHVHAEVAPHLHRLLQQLRESGVGTGLALNPLTPLSVLEGALPYLDAVLLMTVNPGFGGQAFIPRSLARIEAAAKLRDAARATCAIEVDGGIAPGTAAPVRAAGADTLVAGSAVFGGAGTIADNIAALRAAAS